MGNNAEGAEAAGISLGMAAAATKWFKRQGRAGPSEDFRCRSRRAWRSQKFLNECMMIIIKRCNCSKLPLFAAVQKYIWQVRTCLSLRAFRAPGSILPNALPVRQMDILFSRVADVTREPTRQGARVLPIRTSWWPWRQR